MKFYFWPSIVLRSRLSRSALKIVRRTLRLQTRNWLAYLAVGLILAGQLNYLPERLVFLNELITYASSKDTVEAARLAYGVANYDLLEWVKQQTPSDATLLLLTASDRTYGDASYVLYHRAIYHLYPRSVWWVAPVTPTRYPAWWFPTDLSGHNVLALAQKNHVTAILAQGFTRPPLSGPSISFGEKSHLIFLGDSQTKQSFLPPPKPDRRLLVVATLGALLSILLWGDLLIEILTGWLPLHSGGHRLALAWLLGCGISSLGTFILLWIGLSLAWSVASLSLVGFWLWLLVRRNFVAQFPDRIKTVGRWVPGPDSSHLRWPMRPWTVVFVLIIMAQVGLAALAALVSPLTAWDAWVNWASKANVLFIDQLLSPNLHNNPARLPTNLDYPLMLPLVESWFYSWLGQIHEPSVGLISFLFYIALLSLFYHTARQFVSPTPALGFTAWLATVPRLERLAHTGLADIPLTALVLLSFFLLYQEFRFEPASLKIRKPQFQAVVFLALSAGLLPWLKNEGWLWLLVVSVTWLVGLRTRTGRRQLSNRQAIVMIISYFLITLSLASVWQYFLTINGVYRFAFLPLTLTNLLGNLSRLPIIVVEMAKRLLNPYWNFTWLFVALTLLARRRQILQTDMGWLILPTGGFLGLVSLSYVLSRFEPYLAHFNNSAERLILQATPLALWWLLGQTCRGSPAHQVTDRSVMDCG